MKSLILLLIVGFCPQFAYAERNRDDEFHGYYRPYIHPSMRKAIEENEKRVLGPKADVPEDDEEKHHTGFNPTMEFYRAAKYVNVTADQSLIDTYAAKGGLDYRAISYSPVRGQVAGSCWANGSVSAAELNVNSLLPGSKLVFAVQDVIDCSGFGTARGGGQLSLEYALNGLAYESDYPYTDRDGRCNKSVDRHNPLKQAAILRGADGGFPTEPELITALIKYGAMEVCGSASALGNGGRQDKILSGTTNHCYAYGSARPGKSLGWLDKWYHGMKNSWGDGSNSPLNLVKGNWGDKGWGDYVLSTDGTKISGSVITEIMIGFAGDRVPPAPSTFYVEGQGVLLKITLQPFAAYNQADLTARIQSALKDLEG